MTYAYFQIVTKYERDSNGIENKLSKEKYSAWLSILAKDPGYPSVTGSTGHLGVHDAYIIIPQI